MALLQSMALRTGLLLLCSSGVVALGVGATRTPTLDALEWPLLRGLRTCVKEHSLIQAGDRIAVAVSGGKDSSTLAYLLQQLKRRRMLPFDDWSFVAVHVDQVLPGHPFSPYVATPFLPHVRNQMLGFSCCRYSPGTTLQVSASGLGMRG